MTLKNIVPVLLFLFFSRALVAQDLLYSEKTIASIWNENLNDWVKLLEHNNKVTFILTKDHKMILMYCKGSGQHFKKFISNTEYLLSTDTTFYRIISSEVVKDIDGNTIYKFNTQSGLQNNAYLISYSNALNKLSIIFDNASSSGAINFSYRLNKNVFIIKSGSIK